MAHPTWRGRTAAWVAKLDAARRAVLPAVRHVAGRGRPSALENAPKMPLGARRRTGRRTGRGEPRLREVAGILVLLLFACVFSAAGLSGGHAGAPEATLSSDDVAFAPQTDDPTPYPTLTTDPWQLALQFHGSSTPDPTPDPTPSPTPTPAPKKATAPARPYTFVALGDSLTAWPANPWPSRLAKVDPHLQLVHNAGVVGNLTSEMRARLSRDVLAYKPDALLVMGGTNDLAYGVGQATIIANLRAIVTTAKAHGIRVFLMTIPPDAYPHMVARINSLNANILHLALVLNVRSIDIHRPLTSSAGTYISRYTSDGLHFSNLGAQVVANTIYARLRPVGY